MRKLMGSTLLICGVGQSRAYIRIGTANGGTSDSFVTFCEIQGSPFPDKSS